MTATHETSATDINEDTSRELRRYSTEAEKRLWYHLRAGRLEGFKFRRQHPHPPYVLDFYCEAAKLVMELDGSQHNEIADAARTKLLEGAGMKVLRFWDNDVLKDTQAVLETILGVARARTLTPALSRRERGQEETRR